jgi:hypothetical protein
MSDPVPESALGTQGVHLMETQASLCLVLKRLQAGL